MVDPFPVQKVKRVDSKGVHATYEKWPSLARDGFRVKVELPARDFKKVFVLGMGGSASGGDIIAGWLVGRPGVEMAVFKGQLPIGDLSDAIAIACSASGQTVETIGMLKTALERKAHVVSISGGGELKEVSASLGVPNITIPKFVAPRYIFPFILFSTLAVVNRGLALECEEEAEDALSSMEEEGTHLGVGVAPPANGAKVLAAKILRRTPAIYGARVTRGVGIRFKNILNENAKKHALFDGIPDAFHNDIQAWEDPTDAFVPVFVRHSEESPSDSAREDEMVSILARAGKGPIQVRGRGRSSLAQLVTMVYRLDLTSYYIAIGLGRDPFPTRFIDRLKKSR